MPDVTFQVDGRTLTAPAGTLLIDACRAAGIEIPAFCYYPGLSLQAACRMCVVRLEKVPKLQTACTTPVAEGMNVQTDTPEIRQARKATLQLLLGNHPLDCPVCDAGGECELQDMVFKYGAADSFYAEPKNHRDEQQWSPAVYFDRPRCILCYRCVRVCGEGMDVNALGIQFRGSSAVIAPNVPASQSADGLAHLDCEQCGMCIDACPVGALTSGAYRYKTRPWEMNHVATVCTHCGDGCRTTLGVRSSSTGAAIVRADNRDKSGINGDFLCAKGRYAFDFTNHADRLTTPLIRNASGTLEPATWESALEIVGSRLRTLRDARGGNTLAVLGSNRTTNEEAYLLQKFARTVLQTSNIDHHRTADFPTFISALAGSTNKTASLRDVSKAPAILLIGGDPTNQHPALAWEIRTAVRNHNSRLYIANTSAIKLARKAKSSALVSSYAAFAQYLAGDDSAASSASSNTTALTNLRAALRTEDNLLILFGPEISGPTLAAFIRLGLSHSQVKFALLADYANSRGASDMGLHPDLLPGYAPAPTPGMDEAAILAAAASNQLSALYVVGSNPAARHALTRASLQDTFLVVQDLFLTATAQLADVVLPAASLYEKSGSVTNTYGDLQSVRKAADRAGTRSDLELIVRIADCMGAHIPSLVRFTSAATADLGQTRGVQSGEADRTAVFLAAQGLEPRLSPFNPSALLDEIHASVPGYAFNRLHFLCGNDVHLELPASAAPAQPATITPANDSLFTSGSLTAYSAALTQLRAHAPFADPAKNSQQQEAADALA